MQVEDIIQRIVNNKKEEGKINLSGLIITSNDLIPYYYYLVNSEMFKECNLTLFDELDETHLLHPLEKYKSIKLGNRTKFVDKLFIYEISITPAMYNIDEMNAQPKNNASISPAMYNPNSLQPFKVIKIWFNPEGKDEDTIRKNLIIKFNDVLDNPSEYSVSTHGVILRGFFSRVNGEDNGEGEDAITIRN